jgi:3-hydroxyacyl-CoA dehydrogenase
VSVPDVVNVSRRDGVAIVTIDNPPVNALELRVRTALAAALTAISEDAAVEAVLITGTGRAFIAGADIRELERAIWDHAVEPPDFHDLLRLVEDFPRPIVMAINGTALGGGLELAMAGHYRVALSTARLGMPEVNLGIIPGGEGTQRLPRLVGVEKALEMCVSGQPIAAEDAGRSGLVDVVIQDDFLAGALAFARATARREPPHPRTAARADKLGDPATLEGLLAAARDKARKTRRHQTAPLVAVDAIAAAATLPFEEGCRRERALSLECVRSEQARAMVHGFFAERDAARGVATSSGVGAIEINEVAVVGAGTMGMGIAMTCANAGLRVSIADTAPEALERGLATIRRNYESSVERGRLTEGEVAERLSRIRGVVGYDGIASADLVIEAVFESLALKKEVFAEIARRARPGTVLASNTSTLDVDQLAVAAGWAESVVGLHFFSPAQVMRLVEIVRGRATSESVLRAALHFTKRLAKIGVMVGNGPGFVGNRMMFPYMYEAQFLAEEGASPERVDRVLTDWGMAMGIFAVDDMGGLDVAWRIRKELHQFDEPGSRKPRVADRLVELGRLGQKAGRGWYRYAEDRKPIPDPDVLELIESVAREHHIERRSIPDDEILERTVYALINEGARVLEAGIARRAADIDVIYLTGYGFPAFRGGPMFFADSVGLRRVHQRLAAFHRDLGPRFQPAPLLAQLAEEGSSFREHDARLEAAEATIRR